MITDSMPAKLWVRVPHLTINLQGWLRWTEKERNELVKAAQRLNAEQYRREWDETVACEFHYLFPLRQGETKP